MEQTIIFENGQALRLVSCRGGHEQFRDAYRDALSFFIDPTAIGLDEADALFTEENCAKITLSDGENSFVHEGYTERISLMKGAYLLGDGETPLICVKMAQKSETERRMAELETANRILLGLEA